MYVIYLIYDDGASECEYTDDPRIQLYRPSEGIWMVPGTVGVDD